MKAASGNRHSEGRSWPSVCARAVWCIGPGLLAGWTFGPDYQRLRELRVQVEARTMAHRDAAELANIRVPVLRKSDFLS